MAATQEELPEPEIAKTKDGVAYLDSGVPHALYSYAVGDPEKGRIVRMEIWDARQRGEGTRVPVAQTWGEEGMLLAAAGKLSLPNRWKTLRVGHDRVFVHETPQMARMRAIETIDDAFVNPAQAGMKELLQRAFSSREEAIAEATHVIVRQKMPHLQTWTSGLRRAFELNPPTPAPSPKPKALFTVRLLDRVRPKGMEGEPLMMEVVTAWDRETGNLTTGIRIAHDCSDPTCVATETAEIDQTRDIDEARMNHAKLCYLIHEDEKGHTGRMLRKMADAIKQYVGTHHIKHPVVNEAVCTLLREGMVKAKDRLDGGGEPS